MHYILQYIYQFFVLAKKSFMVGIFLVLSNHTKNAKKEEKRRPLLYTSLSGALRVKK
jgi:hypothetical protein